MLISPPRTRLGWGTVLLAVAAAIASFSIAPGLRGALGAALALLMVAIAVVDARSFIIPDELNAGALVVGLLNAFVAGFGPAIEDLGLALVRGLVIAGLFLALRTVHARLRGRAGLGLGDVKLAGVAGVWLGWFALPIAIEIAALSAIAFVLIRQRRRGRPLRATGRLPFGLFLAPAIWIGWLIEIIWMPFG